MKKARRQTTQSRVAGSDYRFIGNVGGLQTSIPALVTEARVEMDKRGNPYVTAQIWIGVASQATEVTMTIYQALEADIIERV